MAFSAHEPPGFAQNFNKIRLIACKTCTKSDLIARIAYKLDLEQSMSLIQIHHSPHKSHNTNPWSQISSIHRN